MVIADTSCGCWSEFRPIINAYISENHIDCLFFKYSEFKDVISKYGVNATKGNTSFIIYQEGQVKVQIKSDSGNTLKNKSDFYKFMEGMVKLPKLYFIEEKNYTDVTDDGAIIYFERSGCSDCTYLNPTVLANYVKKHPDMNNIYVLDCQTWLDNLDPVEYQAKKNRYGLSSTNNPDFGYDTGVYPYFSYVKGGRFLSGAVAFNDTVEKVNNKYVVTNSFYTNERLPELGYLNNVGTKVIKGLELSSSDINDNGEWLSWSRDSAVKYYEPIIDAFLDTYLPQTHYKL